MYCGEQHGYIVHMKLHTLRLKPFIKYTNKMNCCNQLLKSTQKTWVTKYTNKMYCSKWCMYKVQTHNFLQSTAVKKYTTHVLLMYDYISPANNFEEHCFGEKSGAEWNVWIYPKWFLGRRQHQIGPKF